MRSTRTKRSRETEARAGTTMVMARIRITKVIIRVANIRTTKEVLTCLRIPILGSRTSGKMATSEVPVPPTIWRCLVCRVLTIAGTIDMPITLCSGGRTPGQETGTTRVMIEVALAEDPETEQDPATVHNLATM